MAKDGTDSLHLKGVLHAYPFIDPKYGRSLFKSGGFSTQLFLLNKKPLYNDPYLYPLIPPCIYTTL
jgi:hypothetical protein